MGAAALAYASHSFRIGAVTALAEDGLEDSLIRFLRYVRTPREMLAGFTAHLAPASSTPQLNQEEHDTR